MLYLGNQKISPIIRVGSSNPSLGTKNITANGTYQASSDSLDGYSSVTVSVSDSTNDIYSTMYTNRTTGNNGFFAFYWGNADNLNKAFRLVTSSRVNNTNYFDISHVYMEFLYVSAGDGTEVSDYYVNVYDTGQLETFGIYDVLGSGLTYFPYLDTSTNPYDIVIGDAETGQEVMTLLPDTSLRLVDSTGSSTAYFEEV